MGYTGPQTGELHRENDAKNQAIGSVSAFLLGDLPYLPVAY